MNGLPFDVEIEKIKSLTSTIEPHKRKPCDDIKSALPGQVQSILVNVGDEVEKGQSVLTLESMKMENEILAPKNGIVKAILVNSGNIVMKDELLMKIV